MQEKIADSIWVKDVSCEVQTQDLILTIFLFLIIIKLVRGNRG